MVRVISAKYIHKQNTSKINGPMRVYIISFMISIGCILVSYCPYGIESAGVILLSIGCSGVAASIMAFFLECMNIRANKRMAKEYRNILLYDLHVQLKKVFERILWFDKVINEIDLNQEDQYFLSLDFLRKEYVQNNYECLSFEAVKFQVENIISKYKKENITDEIAPQDKVNRMFGIIGNASDLVTYEVNRLRQNKMILILHNVMREEDIDSIIRISDIRFLKVPDSNFSSTILFLWEAYKKIEEICNYKDDFYITWQPSKDFIDLLYEDKMHKSAPIPKPAGE